MKYIQRSVLRPKLHTRCICKGIIRARSNVVASFGVNDGNNKRILLKDVSVDDIRVDHVWIKNEELNNAKKFKKGALIKFDAYVDSYQKNGGRIGIGLGDLQNVEIHN